MPSPWQHEHAGDGEAGRNDETIEFGPLDDDEISQALAAQAARPNQRPPASPADVASEERVEIDFSSDWPANQGEGDESGDVTSGREPMARQHAGESPRLIRAAATARPKGLRIVEDREKLQVVVDPYDLDDEDDADEDQAEHETSGHDVQAAAEATAAPRAWACPPVDCAPSDDADAARLDDCEAATPEVWELHEEIVADRYAELDALQPPPQEPLPADPNEGSPDDWASIPAEGHDGLVADQVLVEGDLGIEGRVTLSEAMRLRREAEAAAAVARVISPPPDAPFRLAIDNVPPLPSLADWLADASGASPDAHPPAPAGPLRRLLT